jgi:hypothetical protein
VAGRIIKNAARRNNQWSPTAAAIANIVVITSVANCNMAIMTCLPICDLGNRTAMTNLNVLIGKDLRSGELLRVCVGHYTPCRAGRTRSRRNWRIIDESTHCRSSNLGSAFRSWSLAGAELPEDLAEDAEGEFGVGGGEVEATDEATDFIFGGSGGAPFL